MDDTEAFPIYSSESRRRHGQREPWSSARKFTVLMFASFVVLLVTGIVYASHNRPASTVVPHAVNADLPSRPPSVPSSSSLPALPVSTPSGRPPVARPTPSLTRQSTSTAIVSPSPSPTLPVPVPSTSHRHDE